MLLTKKAFYGTKLNTRTTMLIIKNPINNPNLI